MATHWQLPAHAQPVHGSGLVTADPGRQYAELIEVGANSSLAVGSLTFSEGSLTYPDTSSSDPVPNITLQFETAAPGQPGHPGGAMSEFYQLTIPLGGSQHLAFPIPLVLTGIPGEAWVLRVTLVGLNAPYCNTNVLAVGCVF